MKRRTARSRGQELLAKVRSYPTWTAEALKAELRDLLHIRHLVSPAARRRMEQATNVEDYILAVNAVETSLWFTRQQIQQCRMALRAKSFCCSVPGCRDTGRAPK